MPPETTGTLRLLCDYGIELVRPASIELPDVFAVGSEVPEFIAKEIHPIEFSLKMAKFFRCHSRKRFIKLLMSMRISRNDAVSLAQKAHDHRWTYQEAWNECLFMSVDVIEFAP